VLIAVGAACVGSDGGIREDELVCEEAVARLTHCCNGLTHPYQCQYLDGCSGPATPEIPPPQAKCIMRASCASLVASDACMGAAQYVSCE
jgi:hypothetical protein